jgi:hypothetical protein
MGDYDGGMRRYHEEFLIIQRRRREGSRLGKSLPAGYYHNLAVCAGL